MAQFASGGRLKSLSTGNGLSIGFDAFHHHYRVKLFGGGGVFTNSSAGDRKRKLLLSAVNASKSSSSSATNTSGGVFDEVLEDDPDIEIDELSGFRGLVLDISYRPVNVVCWKRAICLEFMDKADVLEYYDQTINSPSGSFYIPAVLRVPHLLQVVRRRKVKTGLSRKNILQRDNFTCQSLQLIRCHSCTVLMSTGEDALYCSSEENLTIDHVLPIARGGKWTWENLVAACSRCNSRKGQKTLDEANMKLLKVPKAPKDYDILAIPLTNHTVKMLKMRKGMPEEWRQYLSKPYAAP